jgi:hypothetical protein
MRLLSTAREVSTPICILEFSWLVMLGFVPQPNLQIPRHLKARGIPSSARGKKPDAAAFRGAASIARAVSFATTPRGLSRSQQARRQWRVARDPAFRGANTGVLAKCTRLARRLIWDECAVNVLPGL